MVNRTAKFAHAPTVFTRLFFPYPHKSLGTRLGRVKLVACIKAWVNEHAYNGEYTGILITMTQK